MKNKIVKLSIVVDDSHWQAMGDSKNPDSYEALDVLNRIGGVSETVEPGVHTFTMEKLDEEHFYYTLD